MNQAEIFAPVFAMMLLTLIVWIYMYSRRIPFILQSDFEPGDVTPLEFTKLSPPHVRNPSDNLKNLFEIPILFYVVALYLYVTQQVDSAYLAASWIFVAFRVLHSLVHCTINVVKLRFFLYLVSTISFWFILCRAALAYFGY